MNIYQKAEHAAREILKHAWLSKLLELPHVVTYPVLATALLFAGVSIPAVRRRLESSIRSWDNREVRVTVIEPNGRVTLVTVGPEDREVILRLPKGRGRQR